MRLLAIIGVTMFLPPAEAGLAQHPPVIDVHVHSGEAPSAVLARHDSLGVRFAVVSALQSHLRAWSDIDADRVALGLLFPCERGRMPNSGSRCFEDGAVYPDTTWLRNEVRSGRIRVLGELVPE